MFDVFVLVFVFVFDNQDQTQTLKSHFHEMNKYSRPMIIMHNLNKNMKNDDFGFWS